MNDFTTTARAELARRRAIYHALEAEHAECLSRCQNAMSRWSASRTATSSALEEAKSLEKKWAASLVETKAARREVQSAEMAVEAAIEAYPEGKRI